MCLLKIFWEIRQIEHLDVHPSRLASCEKRFKMVFTKLRALELEDFSRVVLLDLDILVVRGIDDRWS